MRCIGRSLTEHCVNLWQDLTGVALDVVWHLQGFGARIYLHRLRLTRLEFWESRLAFAFCGKRIHSFFQFSKQVSFHGHALYVHCLEFQMRKFCFGGIH
ncbi:hypothetical protein HMPREF1004_00500 [Ralstonia pickettii]|nr:hypothetical protein HMPREF1004_00500 [Ralstonia pickettii]